MEWTTLAKILTSKPEDRQHIMKDLSRAIQKEDLALQLLTWNAYARLL